MHHYGDEYIGRVGLLILWSGKPKCFPEADCPSRQPWFFLSHYLRRKTARSRGNSVDPAPALLPGILEDVRFEPRTGALSFTSKLSTTAGQVAVKAMGEPRPQPALEADDRQKRQARYRNLM